MTEPTDAELLALIEKHLGFKPRRDDTVIDPRTGRFHDVQRYRDMKADILAKWGTPPAVAGEPVAELSVDRFTTQLLALPASHDVRPYGLHKLYTAPQPTQAQAGAVPLTREQALEIVNKKTDVMMAIRLTEAAHGIKGGQHGL